MSEDTKILTTVAGVVVLGAVGIAIVAGLTSEDDTDRRTIVRVEQDGLRPTPTGDAPEPSDPAGPEARIEPDEVEVDTVVETVAAEPFRVDPAEDPVRKGLEAWNARAYDEAAAWFEVAVAEDPDGAWRSYMLGLSLWKSGRLDEAAERMALSAARAEDPTRAFVNLSRIHNDREAFDAALEAARSALEASPEDPAALFLEGRSLRNLGRRDEALASLERSLELDPENGYVLNLLGLTLMESDRHVEAVGALERAAELEPEVAFVHNNLGMALEHSGRDADALACYRRAVELESGSGRAAINLARLEAVVPVEPEASVAIAGTEVETGSATSSDEVSLAEATDPEPVHDGTRP